MTGQGGAQHVPVFGHHVGGIDESRLGRDGATGEIEAGDATRSWRQKLVDKSRRVMAVDERDRWLRGVLVKVSFQVGVWLAGRFCCTDWRGS